MKYTRPENWKDIQGKDMPDQPNLFGMCFEAHIQQCKICSRKRILVLVESTTHFTCLSIDNCEHKVTDQEFVGPVSVSLTGRPKGEKYGISA